MDRLRQMIKDCPYGNKGCVPGDCVLCSEAPRGIRRECLEIIKQGVATQIFEELEESSWTEKTYGMGLVDDGQRRIIDEENYRAIKEKHEVLDA